MTDPNETYTKTERPPWVPHWPATLARVWSVAAAAVALTVMYSVQKGAFASDGWGGLQPRTSGGLVVLALFFIALDDNMFRWNLPIHSVRRIDDVSHGGGLLIPRRQEKLWVFLVVVVVATGFGMNLSVDLTGTTSSVWLIAALGGTVSIAAVSFRRGTELAVFADGFVVRTLLRVFLVRRSSEEFVRWDDVEHFTATTGKARHKVSGMAEPVLEIRASGMQTRGRGDTVKLKMHRLAAEPSAVLSLLNWCRDNPHVRILLTGHDGADLVKPPPLRVRLRLSRRPSRNRSADHSV